MKKPKQKNLTLLKEGPRVEDKFLVNFTEAWIDAGLPPNALSNKKLRKVLESGFSKPLPCVNTLSGNYAQRLYEEKLQQLKTHIQGHNFYIVFDECDHNNEKYYAILIGRLSCEKQHKPYLVSVSKEDVCPNVHIVQQKIIVALTLLGIVDAFEKFRLFITDAAAYNICAAKALSAIYTKMLHVTCFSHMLNRISISLVEYADVNNLVSCIKKVFNKCPSRKKAWKTFNCQEERDGFPVPVVTRWGTWLKSVAFICKNWMDLIKFLENIPADQSKAAEAAHGIMQIPAVSRMVAFISALEFLTRYITVSEQGNFTTAQAVKIVDEITEKLIDLTSTGNEAAKKVLEKLEYVLEKNCGLREMAAIGRGYFTENPQDILVYSFAPCTSVNAERLFSLLNAFLSDKPFITEATMNKLIFIRYNTDFE